MQVGNPRSHEKLVVQRSFSGAAQPEAFPVRRTVLREPAGWATTKALEPPPEVSDFRATIDGSLASAVRTAQSLIFMDPPEPVVASVTA